MPELASRAFTRRIPLPEEVEAIAAAQRGDVDAFAFLYRMHKRRVYSICVRMLKDPADADDMMQEVFLQLHRKVSAFRGESAFSTWLHRMTVNLTLMRLRKKHPEMVSLDEPISDDDRAELTRDLGGCDLALSGAVDRVTLSRAVDSLPPGYRTIFVLHDVEGMEHAEIAAHLGCTVGNSKSQLFKARMRIRAYLLRVSQR